MIRLAIVLFIYNIFGINGIIISEDIKVSDLHTLIFYENKYTKHRRENPIPQLNNFDEIDDNVSFIKCNTLNVDNKFSNIEWECRTSTFDNCYLKNYNILCDEYNDFNHTYIIKDSCRINYNLKCNKSKKNVNAFLTVCSMLLTISILHSGINHLTYFDICKYSIITFFMVQLFSSNFIAILITLLIIYLFKI